MNACQASLANARYLAESSLASSPGLGFDEPANLIETDIQNWLSGGGVNHNETLEQAAEREVAEETGLQVRATRLLYIEEFFDIETRYCKFWFAGEVTGGKLNTASASAADEFIVEAGWFNEVSLGKESIFPEVLRSQYWKDLRVGYSASQQISMPVWQATK